ncbi:conserved hypothetical protein [Streptomyces sp. SPB074]|nr:conserved hypothetical protein [Streptomyces sp. SPB074]
MLAEEKELTRALEDLAARKKNTAAGPKRGGINLHRTGRRYRPAGTLRGTRSVNRVPLHVRAEAEAGCARCAAFLYQIGDLRHLRERGTAFAAVSRAPYPRILPFKAAGGWTVPWYSAYGSTFPYDFGASFAPGPASAAPPAYGYRPRAEADPGREAALAAGEHVDRPALSCFLRVGDQVFHTYSAYARGLDRLGSASSLLDLTALGRRDHLARPAS